MSLVKITLPEAKKISRCKGICEAAHTSLYKTHFNGEKIILFLKPKHDAIEIVFKYNGQSFSIVMDYYAELMDEEKLKDYMQRYPGHTRKYESINEYANYITLPSDVTRAIAMNVLIQQQSRKAQSKAVKIREYNIYLLKHDINETYSIKYLDALEKFKCPDNYEVVFRKKSQYLNQILSVIRDHYGTLDEIKDIHEDTLISLILKHN